MFIRIRTCGKMRFVFFKIELVVVMAHGVGIDRDHLPVFRAQENDISAARSAFNDVLEFTH